MKSFTSRTFRHVKLPGFITSWKMIKKAIKIYRKFFLYETDKKHGTSRGKMLSTVAGWRHLHLIQNFVTSQLWKERLKRDKKLAKIYTLSLMNPLGALRGCTFGIPKTYLTHKIWKKWSTFLTINKLISTWRRSGVFTANFEHISQLVLFQLLTLSR